MLRSISKQQKKEMFHIRLNNFLVFRNYRDIDFSLRSMDVLARNAEISLNWNLMVNFEIKAEDFQVTFLMLFAYVGVGNIDKF